MTEHKPEVKGRREQTKHGPFLAVEESAAKHGPGRMLPSRQGVRREATSPLWPGTAGCPLSWAPSLFTLSIRDEVPLHQSEWIDTESQLPSPPEALQCVADPSTCSVEKTQGHHSCGTLRSLGKSRAFFSSLLVFFH